MMLPGDKQASSIKIAKEYKDTSMLRMLLEGMRKGQNLATKYVKVCVVQGLAARVALNGATGRVEAYEAAEGVCLVRVRAADGEWKVHRLSPVHLEEVSVDAVTYDADEPDAGTDDDGEEEPALVESMPAEVEVARRKTLELRAKLLGAGGKEDVAALVGASPTRLAAAAAAANQNGPRPESASELAAMMGPRGDHEDIKSWAKSQEGQELGGQGARRARS